MKAVPTRLIRIQLLAGDPEGLRSAGIAGRTTEITGCPWTDLPLLLARPEATRPAVYFLVGVPVDGEQTSRFSEAIYIGECDSLKDRFAGKHHKQDAADWTQIFLASETGDTFNKAHGRLAEHILTQRARESQRADVLTRATSRGNISDGDAAFTQEFVENVTILAQVLGVTAFRAAMRTTRKLASDSVADTDDVVTSKYWIYKYGKAQVSARMVQDGKRFIITAGSEIRQTSEPMGQYYGKVMREAAVNAGALVKDELTGVYRFVADYPTSSLSAAAATIYGQNATGPDAWYDEASGVSYREWLAQQALTAAGVTSDE